MNNSTEETIIPPTAIKPLGNRIIIEPPDLNVKNDEPGMLDGVHIPQGVRLGNLDKWREVIGLHHVVTVIACGDECKHVTPGAKIIVAEPSLFYVNSGGVRLCACTEAGVIGIIQ
jgi:hypothetical protein